jgi:hypothetical protein
VYFAAVVALMLVFPLTSIGVQIVRELGFANTAIGSIGIASLFFRDWEFPIAVVGIIFYALAGINHVTDKHRNNLQSFAMASDLFAAAVLLLSSLAAGAR